MERSKQGRLNINPKSGNNKVIVVSEPGLYLISSSFVFNSSNVNGVSITYEASFTNRIGQVIPKLISGQLNSLTGMLFLEEGDELKIRIRNLHNQSIYLVGANNNVNYLKVQKIN